MTQVWRVLALEVPDEVLEERICGRWVHKESGRSYHAKFKPPKSLEEARKADANAQPSVENMLDDETQGALMQRKDDTADALKQRLQTYHTTTVPITSHYANEALPAELVKVNANQSIEEIGADIDKLFPAE